MVSAASPTCRVGAVLLLLVKGQVLEAARFIPQGQSHLLRICTPRSNIVVALIQQLRCQYIFHRCSGSNSGWGARSKSTLYTVCRRAHMSAAAGRGSPPAASHGDPRRRPSPASEACGAACPATAGPRRPPLPAPTPPTLHKYRWWQLFSALTAGSAVHTTPREAAFALCNETLHA